MTGYTEAELLDADCACFNGPLTDRGTIAAFLAAMAEQREFVTEILNYRKDGSSFWNALAVSPVLDDQGRLTHFISINTDISERRLLDQSLQERNLQLQQATTMAEQANRAKSDFLSSMSHELRTPLNSILGFAQLLESGKPTLEPHQQKSIGMIVKGGWYLLTLINEILDLSGIESGKVALSLAPVPLAQALLDCESMVEPQATLKGIRVRFPQADSPQAVIADPIRLKQVIVNLLSNAIKYNRPDGTVDVRVVSNGQGSLRISVHDTGLGLAPEKVAQLFQPFNRLGQEASSTEGTGIGLVVTRRLAELMGGSVGVHSVVGEGSIFWVELLAA
jgi:PAS domain S-box-containing protein